MLNRFGFLGFSILIHGLQLSTQFPHEEKTLDQVKKDATDLEIKLHEINPDEYNYTESAVPVEFPFNKELVCTEYSVVAAAFRACLNITIPDTPQAWFILDTLQVMCREQDAVRSCVMKELQRCDNMDQLTPLLDKSLEYCDGQHVPLAVQIFLEYNYNSYLTFDCMEVIFDIIHSSKCDRSTRPHRVDVHTIPGTIDFMERDFKWHVDCFLQADQEESIPACSNMTRKEAYGILVVSAQVTHGFGMNSYGFFEYFMRVGGTGEVY